MSNEPVLFTPFCRENSRLRAYMKLSPDDFEAWSRLADEDENGVEVFDHVSQALYRVAKADCGGGCKCAAQVIEQLTGTFGMEDAAPLAGGAE